MATTTPYGGLSKRPNSPGPGSPTLSQRGGGNARGRGPLPTPPSQQGAKGSTWTAAPTAWSRRGQAGSPSNTATSSTSPSTAATTYPAYTYPSSSSGGAGLNSTPSKISALTAKFESSTSTRPTSPSPSTSHPSVSSPSTSSPSSSSSLPSLKTPAPTPNPVTSHRAGGGPTSVRTQLINSGGRGASRATTAGKPSWKNLPPPPAAPTADEVVVDAVPDAGSQPDHAVDAEPAQPQEEEEEVTCSLCDHVFVYPVNTACPMCGEAYGAPAEDAAQTLNEEGPRQVECSLCDHPYEYPTLRECPMCGEAYGAPADEPATTSNAAAAAAPGSITAMLMQLQQSVQAQQEDQAQQADNARLEQLRLEEEHDKRPKSIEEESKRMVMCGHCGHTYEYPTYNFCDNCGHPSSNASLRLSQIKRQTWAQGRQSMQIGAGAIEQMLAAAAANGGSGGGGDGQELPGMVNFCPDCGTSTDGGSQRFCGMCGKSFLGDEPALPESDVPTSPTSSRYETGERDKLKKKNKSWGKKTSYRTYFTEVSSSPITSRVKKFSKRGRDDKSSRTIEVKSDWQHMAASLPSTPDAISAYKQMMIAKYEAQQKENVFIRSTSRRGSAEFRSLDTAAMGSYRQDASEDGSLSPQSGYQQAPLSPRSPRSPRVGGGSPYAHTSTSYRAHASSPNLISSPSASYRIAVGHQEIDQQIGAVLAELNLAKYGTAFAQEEVTYEAFLLLEADDLTQMGIPIGPRKLILAKILELKQ